jgi:hypothetical protein
MIDRGLEELVGARLGERHVDPISHPLPPGHSDHGCLDTARLTELLEAEQHGLTLGQKALDLERRASPTDVQQADVVDFKAPFIPPTEPPPMVQDRIPGVDASVLGGGGSLRSWSGPPL